MSNVAMETFHWQLTCRHDNIAENCCVGVK